MQKKITYVSLMVDLVDFCKIKKRLSRLCARQPSVWGQIS